MADNNGNPPKEKMQEEAAAQCLAESRTSPDESHEGLYALRPTKKNKPDNPR
jgi:hypothetical protein